MKKIKFFAIAMAIMTVGLMSCNKDNSDIDVNGAGKTKNVTLLLKNSKSTTVPESRAIDGSAAGDGTTGAVTTLSSGQIFFVDNANEIKAIYTISTNPTEGSNINIAELTGSGVVCAKVSGDYVYVLGNKILDVSKGENFEEKVLKVVMGKVDLSDGKYETAVLTGKGIVVETPVAGGFTYAAKVDISPVAARIEIKKITEISSGQEYTYELEGIYINNYYETSALNGDVLLTPILHLSNNALTTEYTTVESTWHNRISSDVAEKTSNAGTGKVWAFNIFPAKNIVGEDLIPHIIVHLKKVTKGSAVIFPDLYLTIDTYNGTDEFKAGNVYTIANLEFDATKNGDPILESKKFDCNVEVTTLAWIPNTLIPEVN